MKIFYHLPGLFEFYDLYKAFLPLFRRHPEYFYDWCEIGSIYGSPGDAIWGGGRVGFGDESPKRVSELLDEFGISARLTFSNSLIREEHLSDKKCNALCKLFESPTTPIIGATPSGNKSSSIENNGATPGIKSPAVDDCARAIRNCAVRNGIIIHSDLLLDYIRANYPYFYFVSSTTKVITDFSLFKEELDREDFRYVVPDFRLNRKFDKLFALSDAQKQKVEFLCNECCSFGCTDRKKCYENVSRKNLGEDCRDHVCVSVSGKRGYRFSDAMKNPGFIGIREIQEIYGPAGFSHFKIEGRGLGSALVLEFLLYYMTRPEYQINVREDIYLDSELDLF